jgi:hypothetical protein
MMGRAAAWSQRSGGLTILQSGRGDETAEAPLLDEDVRRVEGWVLEQA